MPKNKCGFPGLWKPLKSTLVKYYYNSNLAKRRRTRLSVLNSFTGSSGYYTLDVFFCNITGKQDYIGFPVISGA